MSLTLLVPTDFSKAAGNAVNYAAEMAKRIKASVILYHVYSPPAVVSEIPMVIPPWPESEAYCMKKLRRLKSNLLSKHGNKIPAIEIGCACGIPADEIYLLTLKRKIDFIVMGMQGKGFFKEKLIGSTTTRLIQKSGVPVLSVDRKARFKRPKKIVFANEGKSKISQLALSPLSKLCSLFKSHIYILNVVTVNASRPPLNPNISKAASRAFRKLDHSVHAVVNPSVTEGLNEFIVARRMDMLVMVPHRHTFTDLVLNGRQTRQMAFHSVVPLLTLREQKRKTNLS